MIVYFNLAYMTFVIYDHTDNLKKTIGLFSIMKEQKIFDIS